LKLRLGLVGAGPWGRNYIRTIEGMSEVRLARVAGRADWRDLVRASDIDGVIVAVPPAAQPEIALAAIEAGRPLLLEKPLALSVDAAQRLGAAAAARGVFVMVDHIHLFHPAYEGLKRAAAERGPVLGVEATAGGPGQRAGVPVLWDWGPHDVAMCIDLMGAIPQGVDATRLAASPERLQLGLRFAGGVAAGIELDMREKHRRFAVRLAEQTLFYDAAPPADPAELPLARAVRTFAAAISAGSSSRASIELGVAVVSTLARCEAQLAGKFPSQGERR
jgi:predicted dehydrogenase